MVHKHRTRKQTQQEPTELKERTKMRDWKDKKKLFFFDPRNIRSEAKKKKVFLPV